MKVFVVVVLMCCQNVNGLSIIDNLPDELYEDSSDISYIHFEESNKHNIKGLLKKLEIFLQKPLQVWTTPEKLSSHPTSCDTLTYCERDTRPVSGTFRRLPIYPWWYYSCEGTKVVCKPCPTTKDLDQPTLFFSERCQQCISEYKDEKSRCQRLQSIAQEEDSSWWWKILKRKF